MKIYKMELKSKLLFQPTKHKKEKFKNEEIN